MRIFIPARFKRATNGPRCFRRSAEHGFTPLKRSAQQGFTLVELMVVVAIIGFASAAVMLSIPDPRGRLVDDADRFAVRLAAVRDNAVITARPMAVWVSPSAYGFEHYENGAWVSDDAKPFRTTNWRSGTSALVGDDKARLMLSFDSTGIPSEAARIILARDEERVVIVLDGAGKVRVGE